MPVPGAGRAPQQSHYLRRDILLSNSNNSAFACIMTEDLWCIEYRVELSMDVREVSQCPEKAPTRAFSLLKAPSSRAIKIKNLYRCCAKTQ